MRKYGIPLLVIIIGGWLTRLEAQYLTGDVEDFMVAMTRAFTLFGFGISIQPHHKKSTWVKKLIVSFVFIFLLLWEMGFVRIGFFDIIFDLFCVEVKFVLYLYYIFLGWLFFD